MKPIKILLLILVLLLAYGGLYVWVGYSPHFAKNLTEFEITDFGKLINDLKRDVFAPNPLNVGGDENQAVFTKSRIIAQTNIQRYNNDMMPPLIENEKLSAAARAKAEEMFKNQYFDHVSPSGAGPGELVKEHGYDYIVSGENLIMGNFKDEADIVQKWMDSPGHRANILSDRFTDIGVAIVKGTYEGRIAWIGVQEFGVPLSSCPQPDANLRSNIDANKNTLDDLAAKINEKRKEIDNTNPRAKEYNQLVDEYNSMVQTYNAINNDTKKFISQYNEQVNAFNQCVSGE